MKPAPDIRPARRAKARRCGFVRLAKVLPLPMSGLRVCEYPGGCNVWGSQRRGVGRRSTYWCITHDPGTTRRREDR